MARCQNVAGHWCIYMLRGRHNHCNCSICTIAPVHMMEHLEYITLAVIAMGTYMLLRQAVIHLWSCIYKRSRVTALVLMP